jgi:phosphopantothenoylcysteine decarboxylase/phosphopantothenate--cysteine ligase
MPASPSLNIVLGVGGGIAAYKSASLLRYLKELGHDVHVVPTRSALHFVGSATWEALSGHSVSAEVWDDVAEVPHVRIGQEADLVIVAPATADFMSRAASGAANDLLTNVLLTAQCPVVLAPAMHTEMWLNRATQNNVSILRSRGVVVIDPAVGRLTGSDSGPGRLPEVEQIAQIALAQVSQRSKDLLGKQVLITAGGTREYLDPVRFLGNSSSGKQGIALAQAARDRGAQVTLVCANVTLPLPHGVDVVQVETGSQLAEAVFAGSEHADVVVMAAAVADFAPVQVSDTKMKKVAGQEEVTVTLRPTVDILAALSASKKPGQVVVGFAAETGDSNGSVLQYAERKLAAKGCDLLVVNQVGSGLGFGTDDNEVTILIREPHAVVPVARAAKLVIAHAVLDAVIA